MTQDELTSLLNLSSPPVAIAFVDQPPVGVERIRRSGPASCDYWRQAAEGRTFFTLAEDHKACPIGAHTHHVLTSADEQQQLLGLVQHMADLSTSRWKRCRRFHDGRSPSASPYTVLCRQRRCLLTSCSCEETPAS